MKSLTFHPLTKDQAAKLGLRGELAPTAPAAHDGPDLEALLAAILSVPTHFMQGGDVLLKNTKISRVMNSVAAGVTAQNTSVLDMSGYDSVIFIALVGDVTVASVITLTVNENTANSTSGGSAVTNGATGAVTAGATDTDNKMFVVDVHNLTKQYVFAALTRTAANCVIDGVIAIQYNARSKPQTVDSSISASALAIP